MGEEKRFGLGDVGCMVDVDDAGKRVCFYTQAGREEGPLEVAHARHACCDTLPQYRHHSLGERIDASRDIKTVAGMRVVECSDAHFFIGLDIEGLFVVDKVGYGHIGVERRVVAKGADISGKFFFVENGVDRCEAETVGGDACGQFVETVHRTGRVFYEEAYRIPVLEPLDVAAHFVAFFIDNDVYARCPVCGEYSTQAVEQGLAAYRYQRFGPSDPFLGETRPFSGRYDGIFHSVVVPDFCFADKTCQGL